MPRHVVDKEIKQKEFEELYEMYWKYVFKYEVGYPEDFKSNEYPYDKQSFKQQLEEDGMMIKATDGY